MTKPPVVLCVDDDPEQLLCVLRALRYDGHQLVVASSSTEARLVLAHREVAVLLTDHGLPGESGVELCVACQRMQPATVRVLLTGHRDVGTVLAGINDAAAFRFLTKPVTDAELRAVIAAAVEHHYTLRSGLRDRAADRRLSARLAHIEDAFPGLTIVTRADDDAYLIDSTAEGRVPASWIPG